MMDLDRNGHPDPESGSTPPGPAFAAANAPSYARILFFGSDGLRPGWGLAIYALLFLFLSWWDWPASVELGRSGLWSTLLEELGSFIAAVVPAIVLSRIEHRPWSVYGLPAKQALGARFWSGTVWGFAGISLLMISLYGLHSFSFGHLAVHGMRLVRFAAFWAGFFLLVGLFEEFLLRGYTQFTLARGIGFWPAAIALSAAFGLIHLRNGGEQWPGLLAATWIGLFFCLTLRRTGNLWFAVGFHAAWDWGESFFYSVPDSGMLSPGHLLRSSLRGPDWLSGGTVGPEGSVLCFVVIALTWVLFAKTHPRLHFAAETDASRNCRRPPPAAGLLPPEG